MQVLKPSFTRKWAFGIEEVILIIIVLLNVFDFFEALDPTWDYVKKIVSWTILGYLLYKTSLTNVFFGSKHKDTDFLIVFSYFLLITKNFTYYATVALDEGVHFLIPYYALIANNAIMIERVTFWIGGLFLMIIKAVKKK